MRILYLDLKMSGGTGGKVIRDRNRQLLQEFCGDDFMAVSCPFQFFFYTSMNYRLFGKGKEAIRRIYEIAFLKNKHKAYGDLKRLVNGFKPEYIFCESSALAAADNEIFQQYKFITFFHNVEKVYYEQQYPDYRNDEALSNHYRNIVENEQFICDHAERIIAINERDSAGLQEFYSRSADLILPTSMQDSFYEKYVLNGKGSYLLFVGSDFFGNTDGLFWFIENCLDDISAPLVVVGKGMDQYADKYPDKNVEFTGFVEDLGEYYKNAMAVVLPIISGSGMKTKTCEAFMFGKTVIGTQEAFEGYDNYEAAGGILAGTQEEFINVINDFCERETTAFSREARQYYLDNYSLEKSREIMFEFLRNLK